MVLASLIHRLFFWGGWAALVAIGTLALAATTFTLVRGTRRLAWASEADLRAQWRPVLVGRRVTIAPGGGLHLSVSNVGRGPALSVRAELEGFERPDPALAEPRNTVLPDGESLAFEWQVQLTTSTLGRLICEDVSGAACVTDIIINAADLAVLNIRTAADYSDLFAVHWWQGPMRKRIVRRRLRRYLPEPEQSTKAHSPD